MDIIRNRIDAGSKLTTDLGRDGGSEHTQGIE